MAKRKIVTLAVAGATAVAVVAGGAYWWTQKQHFETTDNAYVQAETVSVSPQIEGYVSEVLVGDNQRVEAGQELVKLDVADPKARLDQALAHLAQVKAAVRSVDDKGRLEQAMIVERSAGVTSAQAAAARAKADLQRYAALAEKGLIAPQKLDETRAGADQSAAAVAQAHASLEAERRNAASLGSMRAQSLAEVAAAEAQVTAARTALDRTVIRAPSAGVVGARGVRAGQYVRPGAALLAIVPVGESYVVANFKETQVARLRLGQPVEIRADAFGGKVIRGKVESFAPATGQEFALIPVENAVGNFTKIAQRLPVRIAVDRDTPLSGGLRPGLSVKVKVDVQANTGPSFAEAGPAPQRLARGNR